MTERAQQPGFQYAEPAQPRDASTLGMWTFLATEVLFFGALFAAYFDYRLWYGDELHRGREPHQGRARHDQHGGPADQQRLHGDGSPLGRGAGAAEREPVARRDAALGLLFLAIKVFEYLEEYQEAWFRALNFDLRRLWPRRRAVLHLVLLRDRASRASPLIGIAFVTFAATAISQGPAPARTVDPHTRPLLALRRHRLDLPVPRDLPCREERMTRPGRTVLRACGRRSSLLLALTTGMAFVPLGSVNLAISLSIAIAKALLVLWVFMEFKGSSGLVRAFAAAGFFWLLILVVLTWADYGYRDDVQVPVTTASPRAP